MSAGPSGNSKTPRRNWNRAETLIAFRLYCATPFGQLHHTQPDIIALADKLGRTPSSVSMKACNFARLDPTHQARGVAGLTHGAKLEETIWQEFHADSEALADEAEAAYEALTLPSPWEGPGEGARTSGVRERAESPAIPEGPTETTATVRVRRVQGFFRRAVLTSYGHRCALTGLAVPQLLTASHIIPWKDAAMKRAEPSNGLCLNALHDRAFDRGLMTFDEDRRAVLSPALKDDDDSGPGSLGHLHAVFTATEGRPLDMPERFAPDEAARAYHRERLFRST